MIKNFNSYIKSLNQKDLVVGSFLTLGMPLLFSPTIGLAAIGTSIIGIPHLLKYFSVKKLTSKEQQFNKLSCSSYEKEFNTYLKTYLEHSYTQGYTKIEKKYKLLLIKMWLESEGINFKQLTKPISQYLSQQCFAISQYRNYELYHFLCDSEMVTLNYENIVGDDLNSIKNLEVIQKVYQDFIHLGLLGKQITCISRDKFSILAKLQNYQLTEQDNFIINKHNKNRSIQEDKCLLTKQQISTMEKIIEQCHYDTVQTLSHFFACHTFVNINQLEFENLEGKLQKRKFHFELDRALMSKEDSNIIRKNKI